MLCLNLLFYEKICNSDVNNTTNINKTQNLKSQNTKNTTTFADVNPGFGFGKAQQFAMDKPVVYA